jgi:hypothetical protein
MTLGSPPSDPPRNGGSGGADASPPGDGVNRRLLPRFAFRRSLEVCLL